MSLREHALSDVPDSLEHQVTFYEDEQVLVDTTVAFLAPALQEGRPAIAVATRDHLTAIERALVREAGRSPNGHPGRFVPVDVHEMLDAVLIDGQPDPEVFAAELDDLLAELPEGPRPRVFGEMAAVLWARGDIAEALALEEIGDDVGRSRSLKLACAYPVQGFDAQDDEAYRRVCAKHSSVAPTEVQALRQRQEQLEAALEELQRQERLRTEFVAMVVHDLQSPVGVVTATLDLLGDIGFQLTDAEHEQLVTGAAENTRRIQRLVDDLLLSVRLESGEFTFDLASGDLHAVVARAASDVHGATGRPIDLDVPFDLPTVLVDEDRQVQVLTNLLSNAVKFSPSEAAVRVTAEHRDPHVVVHVTNEGDPIPDDATDRIFEPFARLQTAAPGTGLGLHIARRLVEGQGGRIWVTPDEQGTTFSYTVATADSQD